MMTPQTSIQDADTVQWTKSTSKNGVAYETGRDRPFAGALRNAFGVGVHWSVGADVWIRTKEDFRSETGVTRYKLHQSSHPFYDWVLEFTTEETYNYHFYDQTGDGYQVNAWETGDHLVRFNSRKPTITFVTGS